MRHPLLLSTSPMIYIYIYRYDKPTHIRYINDTSPLHTYRLSINKLIQTLITTRLKGCLDWDSFATFLRLFSDADAQVRKRRDSLASTQVMCWVRRVDCATQTRLSEAWL